MERPNWEPNDDGSHSLVLGSTGFSARIGGYSVTGWWWVVNGPSVREPVYGKTVTVDEAIEKAEKHLKLEFEAALKQMNEVKQVMWKESN